MDNKFFKHLSRHRVGYLVAALVLTVAGLSTVNTVPNFYTSNNTLTGNVGELANAVVVSENNGSQVYTTDDKISINWQSSDTSGNVYLVPANTNEKTVQIGIVQGQSYSWIIPSNIQTGEYYFGVMSNNALDKSDVPFMIVNTANKTTAEIVNELKSELSAYSARENSAQNMLADLNNQISQAEFNVNALNNEVAQLTASLNEATTYYYTVKATLSVEEDNAQMAKINRLQDQLNQKVLETKNAQAYWDNLKAQAQNAQATIAGLQATMTGIQAKINSFQGLTTTLSTSTSSTSTTTNTFTTATNQAASAGVDTTFTASMKDPLAASAAEYALIIEVVGVNDSASVDDLSAAIDVEESTLAQLGAYYNAATSQKRASDLEVANAQAAYDQATRTVSELTINLQSAQKTVDDLNYQISITRDERALTDLKAQLQTAQNNANTASLNLSNAQNTQQNSMERLSSGKRINAAFDDQLNEITTATQTVRSTLDKLTVKLNDVKSQGTATLSTAGNDNYYTPYRLSNTPSLSEVNTAISTQENLLAQLNEQAKTVASQLSESQNSVTTSQAELRDALSKANELTATMNAYAKRMANLTDQMSNARDEKTLADLQNQFSGVQTALNKTVNLSLTTQTATQSALQRLSSGLRVNSAYSDQTNQIQLAITSVEAELRNLSGLSDQLSSGGASQTSTSTNTFSAETKDDSMTLVEFSAGTVGVTDTDTSNDSLTTETKTEDTTSADATITSDSTSAATSDSTSITTR